MFKAPKYATLLDPREITEGYLRKLFDPCRVTERDFFLAVSEAHRRYYRAHERWFRMLMAGHPGPVRKSKEKKALEDQIEILQDGVVWLIGGLLGRYDEHNNAQAIAKMQELLKASRRRARREQRSKVTQSSGGLQVPFKKGRKG